MPHDHHHAGHQHPETFDEVIARGFPHEQLEALESIHRARAQNRVAPTAAPFTLQTESAVPAIRENQTSFSAAKQTAFRNAITRLVEEGKYLELIEHHMDMSHNMHGTMGEVGFYRFLGWHRRYLLEMEHELQRVDAILRPGVTEQLGIPYWRWQDPFPAWLTGFLPAKDPVSGNTPPSRKNAAPPNKANATDIDIIVNQFSIQDTGLSGENNYTKFSYGIEGWGLRPNGTGLPAHNHGHSWVGGIMNNTSTSPTDPIFWLHHAEVDRLWEIWRQTHPTPGPILSGLDRVMDPWVESYDDLLDTTAMGYVYDSMSL